MDNIKVVTINWVRSLAVQIIESNLDMDNPYISQGFESEAHLSLKSLPKNKCYKPPSSHFFDKDFNRYIVFDRTNPSNTSFKEMVTYAL